uniref:Uncharacterized protein n=1 Tax=Anguilla anguilla TaxID=7936 RepID=A0A0E9SJP9_ANGAN
MRTHIWEKLSQSNEPNLEDKQTQVWISKVTTRESHLGPVGSLRTAPCPL